MICLLLLLKYTGRKGCCYNYNWPFQKTILLRMVDTNMMCCCLNKRNKVSCVNLDELLQMLIRKVLILPSQHWQGHEQLTPCPATQASYKSLSWFSSYWWHSQCLTPKVMLKNAYHHLPDHVVSFPRRQYKLSSDGIWKDPKTIYRTDSTLNFMLASKAAQMVCIFTHSLQYVQLLSTFGGHFHF